ncbi:SDR family oxidoreductase [Alteromonas sp. ZYF713]|nr:SDR family oxidoreductase [Alteromonas sp. ZYF713]
MKDVFTLITGGTTGIGYETASLLIREGKQVIITGQNSERVNSAARELGCKGIVADSANLSSIDQLVSALQADKITLNGLVLNAGVFLPEKVEEMTDSVFDKHMNINTKGVCFTLTKLLPAMKNPSSVVFISSIVVDRGFEACATYAASKAAVEAFIRVANKELAEKGIRLNTVRPGVTATPIQSKAGMDDKGYAALMESLTHLPIKRALLPSDHATAISFLLSDASLTMRNAVLQIDGGYCL